MKSLTLKIEYGCPGDFAKAVKFVSDHVARGGTELNTSLSGVCDITMYPTPEPVADSK